MRTKKCRVCRSSFSPSRPMQVVCGPVCAHQYINQQKKKKQDEDKRAERKADKEKLARITPGYLEAKAQDAINEYVRLRDYNKGCISCGKPAHWDGQWHAGHLKTRGANSFLRYHLWNINKQCCQCNDTFSGNVAEHERGIVARYGQDRLDFLHCAPKMRRYDDDYLIRLASVFRKKSRRLKKALGI